MSKEIDISNAEKSVAFYGNKSGFVRLSPDGEDLLLREHSSGVMYVIEPVNKTPVVLKWG